MARTKRRDEDADDDVLRDGECMTVKMSAMDSLQRSVAEHYGLVTDATGDSGASLHRPGYRINNTVTRDTSFYDTYDAEQAVAYKNTGAGEREFAGQREGDSCTVKFGGGRFGPEGSAGTLQRVDGALVCVAIKSSDSQTMDTRADAYRIYEAEISQAWRTP